LEQEKIIIERNRRIVDKENENQEIFSERVRAGKRTYFFDVKATRSNDYYLTITESKRKYNEDGFTYEKHKIFLYKEDFNKFVTALNKTVGHIKEELLPDVDFDQFNHREPREPRVPRVPREESTKENENVEEKESEGAGIDTELKWE